MITPQKSETNQQKPRLLLLHGVGLNAKAYDGVKERLSLDLFSKISTLELPAHGHCARAPLRSLDDGVEQVLAALSDQPTIFVGHSLGALIALRLACVTATKSSHNLKGFVLMNTVYQRSPQAQRAVIERAEAIKAGENDPEPTLERWYQDAYPRLRAQTREFLLACPQGYAAAYHVFAHHQDEPAEALAGINRPLLLLTGEKDKNSTPLMSSQLAKMIPKAQTGVIKGAGHMALMTHPNECAKAIEDFVTSLD